VPTALRFDPGNALHMEFLRAAANLRAFNFGIPGAASLSLFVSVCLRCC
jgi:hypothetical protein